MSKIFLKYEFENNDELYQFVANISEFENYKLRKTFKKNQRIEESYERST